MKRIIAFEGHNGVGKSTVALEFSKRINARYLYGVDQDSLNNGLKEKFIKKASWYASALHFFAGCMEIKRKINEEYLEEKFVLDRSYWSTLAVNWEKGKSNIDMLLQIIKDGKEFLPIPDIIIILTADYSECMSRIKGKNSQLEKDLDSVVDEKYYNKEQNFYYWLCGNKDKKTEVIKIDTNNKSIDEIVIICMNFYDDKWGIK